MRGSPSGHGFAAPSQERRDLSPANQTARWVALRQAWWTATASMAGSKEANTTEPTGLCSAKSLTNTEVVGLIQTDLRGDLIVADTQQ